MCAGISLTFEKHRLISKPNQTSELLLWIVSRCKLTVKGYKHASTYHFTVNQSCFLCRICVGNSAPVVSNSTQMGMLVTTSATQSKFNLLVQTAAQTAALYRKLVGISGARLATCITSMHIALPWQMVADMCHTHAYTWHTHLRISAPHATLAAWHTSCTPCSSICGQLAITMCLQ